MDETCGEHGCQRKVTVKTKRTDGYGREKYFCEKHFAEKVGKYALTVERIKK